MRVLMLTRRVDQDDARAGFAHTWISRLAAHECVDHLDVICLERGKYDLPSNVRVISMGKERGYGRLSQLWQFQAALARTVRHADVIFGHMIPRYILIAAPWAKLFRKPMVQWYVHRHVSHELRIVHALVDRVVTASAESFRLPSNKLSILGHGIDMKLFHYGEPQPQHERLIVAVGRLSPIKHYELLIDALALLAHQPGFEDVHVEIAGSATDEHGEAYAQSLQDRAAAHNLSDRIRFLGPVAYRDIPALDRRALVTVNLCPTGGVDKAVIESMASGVPVVVRNETFLPILSGDAHLLWCPDDSPATLADRLAAVLSLPLEERSQLGKRLHERVQEGYDLNRLIDRLVATFKAVAAERISY